MTISSIANRVKANVEPIDALLGAGEAVALAVTTRLANWLSAIPTIALTSRAIADTFSLSPGLSVITSISLEIVGQSVVSVWFNAKAWNNSKRKSDPALDEKLPLALIAAYFATDFALVAIQVLPRALAGNPGHIIGLAFPVMGMVTLLATNCRVRLFQVAQEVAQGDAKRKAERKAGASIGSKVVNLDNVLVKPRKVVDKVGADLVNLVNGNGKVGASLDNLDNGGDNLAQPLSTEERRLQLLDIWRQDGTQAFKDLGARFGVSRQTIGNDLAFLRKAGKVRRNGRGVEVVG